MNKSYYYIILFILWNLTSAYASDVSVDSVGSSPADSSIPGSGGDEEAKRREGGGSKSLTLPSIGRGRSSVVKSQSDVSRRALERDQATRAPLEATSRKDINCRALYGGAKDFLLRGQSKLAKKAFKRLLKCQDTSPGSHHWLFEAAELLDEQGKTKLANKMWVKYMDHVRTDCTDLHEVAQYFRSKGRKDLELLAWQKLQEKLEARAERVSPFRREVDAALAELSSQVTSTSSGPSVQSRKARTE